jgi:hypothetical protein
MTTSLFPVMLEFPQNILSRDLVETWRRLHQPLEATCKNAMMSLFRQLATAVDKL